MRTRSPASVASNPSIRTSSSSRSTSLSGRGPLGRGRVDSSSCGRGPWGGPGLMVSLDDADPASRIDGREGGTGLVWCPVGLDGRGARWGSGRGAPFGIVLLAAGFGAAGLGAAGFGAADLGAADLGAAGLRLAPERLAALRGGLEAGFAAARTRGAWPRARDGFLGRRLEELTPQFSNSAHRVGRCLQR